MGHGQGSGAAEGQRWAGGTVGSDAHGVVYTF